MEYKEKLITLLEVRRYFEKSAKNTTLPAAEIPEFYKHLQILIATLHMPPPELDWDTSQTICDISASLMCSIASCNLQLDVQLLCSRAFCSALQSILQPSELQHLFHCYLTTKDLIFLYSSSVPCKASVQNLEVFKVCLCHGMLKNSACILQDFREENTLLFPMFDTLEESCMKYSRLTSITFKVLVLWLKEVCSELKFSLPVDIFMRLFSIINSNWESPVSGVKEQNGKLFELFLDTCSRKTPEQLNNNANDISFQSISKLLHLVMEEQPWKMKSKYFMLSLLLPRYGVKKAFVTFPNLASGLVSSLSHSHLTSAGHDVYRACLKCLDVDDWMNIFLEEITKILTDKTDIVSIEKQNLLNYWLPATLQTFPSHVALLLEQIVNTTDPSDWKCIIFSIISLIKLGRKRGSILSIWNEKFSIGALEYEDFLHLLEGALEHSNENIRAEALALVSSSTKTNVVPSVTEFELVKQFLLNNVSIDSPFLRQAILNSLALFLIRLLDSTLYKLNMENGEQNIGKANKSEKKRQYIKECINKELTRIFNFLEWLYYFLLSNLEPGGNYQRKIISLQIYKLVLTYFGESSEKQNNDMKLKRKNIDKNGWKKVIDCASKFGKWHYHSEKSHQILLNCVLDSTDDIREVAGLILSEYFTLGEESIVKSRQLADHALKLCSSPMFYETECGAILLKVIGNWAYKMPAKNSNLLIRNITKMKYNKYTERQKKVNKKRLDIGTNLNISRNFGSILTLNNQEKLLAALRNKSPGSLHPGKEVDNKKIKLKAPIPCGYYETMIAATPDIIEEERGVKLPEESRIMENLCTVAWDGTVGERTDSSLKMKSKILEESSFRSSGGDNARNSSAFRKSQDSQNLTVSEFDWWNDDDFLNGDKCFESARKGNKNDDSYFPSSSLLGNNEHNFSSNAWSKSDKYSESSRRERTQFKDESSPDCNFNGPSFLDTGSSEFPELCNSRSSLKSNRYSSSHKKKYNRNSSSHKKKYNRNSRGKKTETLAQAPTAYHFYNKNYPSLSSPTFRMERQELLANKVGVENSHAPLSIFLLLQAEVQFEDLKTDIFKAASSGSPLHGTLTALIRLSAQEGGPEYGCMSAMEVNRTLNLLEQAVAYLLNLLAAKSDTSEGIAPSFAQMDEAINSSIQESMCLLETSEEENLQLSPAHQLVLNCIWLNLKVCCLLASGLPCSKNCSVSAIKRCGNIITQVLTRCRHKGAIESAGVALSTFVKVVTLSHPSDKVVQVMLEELLTEFLDSFVSGNSKGSVTRRSAGLSILVQKIISSDTQLGKPLLHRCVSQLLDIAKIPLDSKITTDPESVLIDLPQAQSLHFLRILVQDASLKQDIAPYMSSIAIICFTKFSSPVWTIRNAALQLSGALIPKLVGQKKVQDEDVTLASSISAEEFFSHVPELTDFMLTSLKKAANCHPSRALKAHADLIPMLSLLSKVAIGVEAFISIALAKKIKHYRISLLQLLSSPIHNVRKLAAKTYERFIPFTNTFEVIVMLINKLKLSQEGIGGHFLQENEINGILLALKYFAEKLKHESENISEVKIKLLDINMLLKKATSNVTIWNRCTYFNRLLLIDLTENDTNVEEVVYNSDVAFQRIMEVHKTLEQEKINPSFKPGLFLWAAKLIDVTIKRCRSDYVVLMWYNSYVLFNSYPDIIRAAFDSLKWRIESDKDMNEAVTSLLLISLLKIGLDITEDSPLHISFLLLDMLMFIQDTNLNTVVTFRDVQTVASWCLNDEKDRTKCRIIALPVVTGLISQHFVCEMYPELPVPLLQFILNIANCIKIRTDASEYDEDFRLNAARAMHLLVPSLQTVVIPELIKCGESLVREMLRDIMETLLNSLIDFLQDEDHDVRKEAAIFFTKYANKMTDNTLMNPYVCLQKLIEPDMLLTLLPVPYAIGFLWKKLNYKDEFREIHEECEIQHNEAHVLSPFDHGKNNIYSEEIKMIESYGKSLLSILWNANSEEQNKLKNLIESLLVSFYHDAVIMLSLLENTRSNNFSAVSPQTVRFYIVAKKLIYISELMITLKIEFDCDKEYVIQDLKQFLSFEL